jgi:hypothetical protein
MAQGAVSKLERRRALSKTGARLPTTSRRDAKRKAAKMAGQEIDRLGDQTVTREERAQRKRRLIKGPREFRDIRKNKS